MTGEDSRPVAAAIDIGSNSIKMTVARPDGVGGIEQIDWASEVVRLGQGIDQTGLLDRERMDAAIAALTRFVAQARQHGATRLVAVATEATRSTENGPAFMQRVQQETGISVRVIDGLEEAALTFRGLAATTDISGRLVIADIGGASTELIVVNDGIMLGARSIPLGSGRITERFMLSDPPSLDELAASEAEADAVVQRAAKSLKLPRGEGARLVIVGGTGEFMAKLVPDEGAIAFKDVKNVLAKLGVLTAAELADIIEAPEARARVLPAGVAIVSAIANRVQPTRIEIARSGIRAGLLIEAFSGQPIPSKGRLAPAKTPRRGKEATDRVKNVSGEQNSGIAQVPAFRAVMKTLIGQRWAGVWKAIPAALEGTDIEGVHDVRVASRRLRAAMDIAAPVFPTGWYTPLHREAKQITSALGEVRDRDVLLEALHMDRENAPVTEHPGIDRLIGRIDEERVTARAEMERYLSQLLKGPIRKEIERRFGSVDGSAEHRGHAERRKR